MEYPGRAIRAGEQDTGIVKTLNKQLNEMLGSTSIPH
jgi:hypothetical protein